MRNLLALQHSTEQLRGFNAHAADQHGLRFRVGFSDFLDHRVVFFAPRFVDAIVVIRASHRPIGRDHVHVEFINVVKLCRFRFGCAGHSRQFLIKPEIILYRDRRQSLSLAIDLDAFLCFHGLMQTIAPSSPRHFAPGELIDNYDFVILDDVLDVFLEQAVGAQQL